MIKIRAEVNERGRKNYKLMRQRVGSLKRWGNLKYSQLNWPNKRERRIKPNKIGNKKGAINNTTNTNEIHKIMRIFLDDYLTKLENFKEMDEVLDTYDIEN